MKLAILSVLLVAAVSGCGSASDGPRSRTGGPTPTPKPSAQQLREAKAAASALRKHGALLAGPIEPRAVVSVDECDPPADGSGLIHCWFGQGVDAEDPSLFRVRLQSDGTLSKALGEADPVSESKTSAQTASLLDADDDLHHAPSRTHSYRCAPSPRLSPRGVREGTSPTGQLCSTYFRVSRMTVRRYVEFAPDGTATRDYIVHTDS